ncbi:MAG: type II toxin-antitoxin system VapC family toxin [Chloroflexota bacterium]
MIDFILDASAVLALLNDETGSDAVTPLIPASVICSVNLSEVIAKLLEKGVSEADVTTIISVIGIGNIVDFDRQLSWEAGRLRPMTKQAGLSFGDRACLAVACSRKFIAVTADRSWETLSLCQVKTIR